MTRPTLKPLSVALALAGAAVLSQPAFAQEAATGDEGLAAATLSEGESVRAIAMLKTALEEHPGDPAILINLGIAYAQAGSDAEARASFEAALASREVVELQTASGRDTDSRRLARRALGMLERGEFRPTASSRFSLRE